jgi:hypothetical protein
MNEKLAIYGGPKAKTTPGYCYGRNPDGEVMYKRWRIQLFSLDPPQHFSFMHLIIAFFAALDLIDCQAFPLGRRLNPSVVLQMPETAPTLSIKILNRYSQNLKSLQDTTLLEIRR